MSRKTMVESAREPFREWLRSVGENPDREGLRDTPHRVWESLMELTSGYGTKTEDFFNHALFECDHRGMVWVRDVAFYSLCEHHLLPFFGHCTVAYLPKGKVLGLSKIHDVVKMYARRLQLQERLTEQIAQTIYALCPSEGVGVFMRAKHLCIAMRGVQQETSETETYRLLGRFEEDESTRREFLTGLQRNKTNMLPSLLEVRTLPISVSLGCDAEEKRTKTTVHLDLSLKFPSPPPACSTDRLEDTLCYDRLSKSVARFCGRKHFNLIEHLAYDLYRHLKEKWIPSLYSSSPALRVCLIKDLSSSHQSRFTVGDF